MDQSVFFISNISSLEQNTNLSRNAINQSTMNIPILIENRDLTPVLILYSSKICENTVRPQQNIQFTDKPNFLNCPKCKANVKSCVTLKQKGFHRLFKSNNIYFFNF